jgi:hypothetical protein
VHFVKVIPSCCHFVKMCLCQVSLLSRCSLRYLVELHIVHTDQWARFSSCGECDVDILGSVSFLLHF